MSIIKSEVDEKLPVVNWNFPESTKFGRIIPKDKLYKQIGAPTSLKNQFIEQVEQINWLYKLAENTIHLTKTESVSEIEVIQILLKQDYLDEIILEVIDKAIPYPTLFLISRKKIDLVQNRWAAAHKLKSTSTNGKESWRQSQYLKSAWYSPEEERITRLPTAINLQRLYEQLLEDLIPKSSEINAARQEKSVRQISEQKANDNIDQKRQDEHKYQSIEEKLVTLAEIETLNKRILQTKAKRDKEKQFNRRRELNDTYKELKKQLAQLQARL